MDIVHLYANYKTCVNLIINLAIKDYGTCLDQHFLVKSCLFLFYQRQGRHPFNETKTENSYALVFAD